MKKLKKILTKFTGHAIINFKDNHSGKIKIWMEAYTGNINENMSLSDMEKEVIDGISQHKDAGSKKYIFITSLHANLKDCALYLTKLFYKTGKKYSCSQTKLGKLLSIAAFVCARRREKLFDENIYKYDDCGTAIKGLLLYFDRERYVLYKYSDERTKICDCLFDESLVPDELRNIQEPSDYIKSIIDDVFINFGAYNARDLGCCLNPIVLHEGVTNSDNIIDLQQIYFLKQEEFSNCPNNDVIIYLFNTSGIEETDDGK